MGPLPMLMLTREEYQRSVEQIVGAPPPALVAFPTEDRNPAGFRTYKTASELQVRSYMEASETLAVAMAGATTALCQGLDEPTCATRFVETYAARAFRRPVSASEVADLRKVYERGRAELALGHAEALELAGRAILQSPRFVYRWEVGPDEVLAKEGDLVALTAHQVASRLSYALTKCGPDAELRALADKGELLTPGTVENQLARLWTERSTVARGLGGFVEEWLRVDLEGVNKATAIYPEFTEATRSALAREVGAFVEDVWLAPQGAANVHALLNSPMARVFPETAALYGQAAPGAPMTLDVGRRGVLLQAAFLSSRASPDRSHPPKRGDAVWQRLLCGKMPALPAELPPVPPPTAGQSTREVFQALTAPCAAGCHAFINPLGYAFEHYDGIGRFRSEDGGRAVDASGKFRTPAGEMLEFADAAQLMEQLGSHAEVLACTGRYLAAYTLGRSEFVTQPGEDRFGQALVEQKGDVRPFLEGLVASKAFVFRLPDEGETLP